MAFVRYNKAFENQEREVFMTVTEKRKAKKQNGFCDFCGKPSAQVGKLIEGEGSMENGRPAPQKKVYICSGCVGLCGELLTNFLSERKVRQVPNPSEIVEILDEHVVGQEQTKRTLAVAVANHYKRLRGNNISTDNPLKDVEIEKSNILLVGPTGSGKTLLAKKLAEILEVPFAIGDATTVTEAGYVGEDVENLLLKLLRNADFDTELAQNGIIYIDEVDKIGRTSRNVSITRDVSGEGVQQALLKMLEGTVANIPPQGGRKHPEQQYVQMDTSNILFICGGTFVGLEDIIARRIGKKKLGFGADSQEEERDRNEILRHVTSDDLVEYGMIPEFVGRLPVLTSLSTLSDEDLVRILLEPKNALIKQYQKIFLFDQCDLQFTESALVEIARKAKLLDTGARALRSVIESLMTDIMFDLHKYRQQKILITDKFVRGEESLVKAA